MILWAALAALLARPAAAHCAVQYQITGPGGLFFEVNLGGNHYVGALPGGTTAQLGGPFTWTDVRELDVTGGTMPVTMQVTDTDFGANCPEVDVSLDGPPQCGDDAPPFGFPSCTPSFTITVNGPGSYSCASTCLSYPQPRTSPVTFTPHSDPAPTATALSPSSATTGGPSVGVGISGSGFTPTSLAQWNGAAVTTLFVDASTVFAAIPSPLLSSARLAGVSVANTGGSSAPLTFVVAGVPPPSPPPAPVSQPTLAGARVYPNPWKSTMAVPAVTFDTMPPGSRVVLFTLSGRRVATLDAPGGATQWNLADGDGRAVGSGLYFFIIHDGQGGRVRGRLGVIR